MLCFTPPPESAPGIGLRPGRLGRRGLPRWPAVAGLAMLLSLGAGAARADDDHERAREAVAAGRVLPLRTLMERLAKTHPGEVLEVELEDEDGTLYYELKLLQPGGALRKLKVDARSGEVLRTRSHGPARGRDAAREATPDGRRPGVERAAASEAMREAAPARSAASRATP